MRILISVILTVAVLSALVVGITLAGAAVANSAGKAFEEGPMRSGFVPRIAFVLLLALIVGTGLGFIGGV
ncbi:hypothetical protein [Tropicimonas sp. IMCC6043]|uniref:hypothetical protein n=1 Tax=Tropicimonas sp. IMCC6043 TaxID=2510645 RepID=UPI00101D6AA9|nr:hypothetical protein [Tropicimonas sp. IMCC6043]RYH10314.1 hypothetical protein EU800_08460 [Tropicimonas sp. IMCC6043]